MNKNIIFITGASSDIGLNFIKNIDDNSLIIAHYYKFEDDLKQLSSIIKNEIIMIQADLTDDGDIYKMLYYIESNYGLPNKIIHLAAPKFENIRFRDINWEKFQNEIDISLKSIIIILNRFLPKMAKLKCGKVVIMLSSVTLNIPPQALTQYTTVKYAMLGLVKSLASEYATKNIQINALSPSMIETKFLNNINEKLIEFNAYNHPLNRNANVNDVTPIIKMLISKESDYINGINIPITGGSIF